VALLRAEEIKWTDIETKRGIAGQHRGSRAFDASAGKGSPESPNDTAPLIQSVRARVNGAPRRADKKMSSASALYSPK